MHKPDNSPVIVHIKALKGVTSLPSWTFINSNPDFGRVQMAQ